MAKSTISCVLCTYPVKQRVPIRNEVRQRQLCTRTNAVACLRYLLEISKQLASQIKQQNLKTKQHQSGLQKPY